MRFNYVATDAAGKRRHGEIDALNARAARLQLRDQGLTPESLREATTQSRHGKRGGLRNRELVLLTRQLATLAGASLPLEQCLAALAGQAEKPRVQQMLATLRQKIQEGETFASALAHYPAAFSAIYRATVAAGEASGQLSRVLEQLADYSERMQMMKSKLTQALIYPLMLTSVATAVVIILLTAVVPRVTEQFIQMKQALPLATRLLLALSDALLSAGPWLLLTLLLIGLGLRIAVRKPDSQIIWHRRLLVVPVLGNTLRDLDVARYARTLSILTSSAVPLLESMRISASVLVNAHIRTQLQQAGERVREGTSLTQAVGDTRLLSPMMQHMIASGESSGKLNMMLGRAAELQENTFSSQVTIALALFEPLLVTVMAGVVLFIILAILQPILQLNSLIG